MPTVSAKKTHYSVQCSCRKYCLQTAHHNLTDSRQAKPTDSQANRISSVNKIHNLYGRGHSCDECELKFRVVVFFAAFHLCGPNPESHQLWTEPYMWIWVFSPNIRGFSLCWDFPPTSNTEHSYHFLSILLLALIVLWDVINKYSPE